MHHKWQKKNRHVVCSFLFMRSPMQRKYVAKATHGARGE